MWLAAVFTFNQFFKFEFYFLILWVGVFCLHVWMCAACVPRALKVRSHQIPPKRVASGFELLCGCPEASLGPLQEHRHSYLPGKPRSCPKFTALPDCKLFWVSLMTSIKGTDSFIVQLWASPLTAQPSLQPATNMFELYVDSNLLILCFSFLGFALCVCCCCYCFNYLYVVIVKLTFGIMKNMFGFVFWDSLIVTLNSSGPPTFQRLGLQTWATVPRCNSFLIVSQCRWALWYLIYSKQNLLMYLRQYSSGWPKTPRDPSTFASEW